MDPILTVCLSCRCRRDEREFDEVGLGYSRICKPCVARLERILAPTSGAEREKLRSEIERRQDAFRHFLHGFDAGAIEGGALGIAFSVAVGMVTSLAAQAFGPNVVAGVLTTALVFLAWAGKSVLVAWCFRRPVVFTDMKPDAGGPPPT